MFGCIFCKLMFTKKNIKLHESKCLKQVKELSHQEKCCSIKWNAYPCEECMEKFDSEEELKLHKCREAESEKDPASKVFPHLACKKCGLKFFNQDDQVLHQSKCSKSKFRTKCDSCLRHFISHKAWKDHQYRFRFKKCTPQPEYPCKTCKRKFRGKQKLQTHVCIRKKTSETDKTESSQSTVQTNKVFCPTSSPTKPSKPWHTKTIVNDLQCPQCATIFEDQDALNGHYCAPLELECTKCATMFNGNSWKLHKCQEKETFSCEKCEAKFNSKNLLEKHMMEHNSAKQCSDENAMVVHTDIEMMSEEVSCDTKSGGNNVLQMAIDLIFEDHEECYADSSTHLKQEISAEQCNDVNAMVVKRCETTLVQDTEISLKSLMSLVQNFQCPQCAMIFEDLEACNDHYLTHLVPEYSECGKTFKKSSWRHECKERQIFSCEKCDASFSLKSLLQKHMLEHNIAQQCRDENVFVMNSYSEILAEEENCETTPIEDTDVVQRALDIFLGIS